MGILLSVLVTCVAVVEALAVGRRVGLCVGLSYGRTKPDLTEYTRSVREKLKEAELVEDSGEDEEDVKSWSTWSTPGATPQEEFLRNLDGISSQRSLKRDSGSRKRRSFRSRRSGESRDKENSTSAEASIARKKVLEEELKALTALEEDENPMPQNLKNEVEDNYNDKQSENNTKDHRISNDEDNKKEAFWVKNDV